MDFADQDANLLFSQLGAEGKVDVLFVISLTTVLLHSTINSILNILGGVEVNKKQRKILAQIFEIPIRSDVRWYDIETLLAGFGAEITEGNGSRVRIALHGVRAVFHRPHPQDITDKGALVSVRKFLTHAGIHHDEI